MNRCFFHVLLCLSLTLHNSNQLNAQAVNTQDSLALVDLFNSTNGPNWTNKTNWNSIQPLSTWYRVIVVGGRVTSVSLDANNLVGTLPASLQNLTALNTLILFNNHLSGPLPSLSTFPNLDFVSLGFNAFTGTIPDPFLTTTPTRIINLTGNKLTGPIPLNIGNPAFTTGLGLGNNQLTGTIPLSLGRLKLLTTLNLNQNALTGSIPDTLYRLTSMQQISLSNNKFTGGLSDSVLNFTNLRTIDAGNNQLSGTLPVLNSLTQLSSIFIAGNQFEGPVPSFFGLPNLTSVGVYNNHFNFTGLESRPVLSTGFFYYWPQLPIPITSIGNTFSVTAGGTLANDTFRLYKDGRLRGTKVGDSVFTSNVSGRYNVTVINSMAPDLKLQSDTIAQTGIPLEISNATVSATITNTGSSVVDIENSISNRLLLTIDATTGTNLLNGQVDCKVTIDPAASSYNGQAYVQRHYDIEPANNAATSTARVTLYFEQADFDNFNSAPAHGLNLPASPNDAVGKANLRVYQYHGFSASSTPGTYSGSAVEINPNDNDIVWNQLGNYWEVSFNVAGFSGFFVSSQSSALLPVNLISFNGKADDKQVLLQWITASETNTAYFELQRSTDGVVFTTVGSIQAGMNSTGNITYSYCDAGATQPGNFYRLKIFDRDGAITYSKAILTSRGNQKISFKVYPNPVSDLLVVQFPEIVQASYITVTEGGGRLMQKIYLQQGNTQCMLNVKSFLPGNYIISLHEGEKVTSRGFIVN